MHESLVVAFIEYGGVSALDRLLSFGDVGWQVMEPQLDDAHTQLGERQLGYTPRSMRRDGLQRLSGVTPSRERRVLLGEEHAPRSELVIPHDRRRFARGKGIAHDGAQYVRGYVCCSELGGEVRQHVPAYE